MLDSSSYESDERNHQLESRVSGPFSQKTKRKQGRVYITVGTYGTPINIKQEDIDKYDFIIEIRHFGIDGNKEGFAPFILHKKR